jgi:predicted nucleotide-binding protein
MSIKDFNIAIMHGTATEYRTVQKFIKKLGYSPIILKDTITHNYLLENVRNVIWEKAHCAIVIMSPDDMTKQRQFRARQNVVFELGYCLGAFDSIDEDYWYHAVIIIKEKSVETFSDIGGVQFIEYQKIITEETLTMLKATLKKTFKNAKNYYDEL